MIQFLLLVPDNYSRVNATKTLQETVLQPASIAASLAKAKKLNVSQFFRLRGSPHKNIFLKYVVGTQSFTIFDVLLTVLLFNLQPLGGVKERNSEFRGNEPFR